jgi:predicted ATPase/DNA-binding CsgD family transcriptional regulator
VTELVMDEELTDLPLEVTSFVGRRADRTRVHEMMAEFRLVTLTGFGGIGKTRLALKMARQLRRAFPDGVYLVSLALVDDASAVPDQVAAALGLHGRPSQSATSTIVDFLRRRTVLLVLDNCEHVIDAVARLADTVLRTCAHIRILATSREPVRIDGEGVYALEPLTIPAGESTGAQPLIQYESVQLFLDRARAVLPDFTLTDDNRAHVAEICRKLEGIPLAIELAAARLRGFSPAQLDAQLADRWELLNRGSRVAPDRHSTMAACIEWSFDLCTAEEMVLWAKTSVFVDGFDLDACIAVCSDEQDGDRLKETLFSLVDKSVLTVARHDSTNRFRMLPPIRHRGRLELERLGLDGLLRDKHRDFYLELASRAHAAWFSSRQLEWIQRLRAESGNIGEALAAYGDQAGDADAALRAGASLMEFRLLEGRYQQGRRWFEQMFAQSAGDPEARALALRAATFWAVLQGDLPRAQTLLDEAQSLATRVTDQVRTLITQTAGLVAIWSGDAQAAMQLLDEANGGFTVAGDTAELAMTCLLRTLAHSISGDLNGALAHHERLMELTDSAGELWLRSWSLWAAGNALCTTGKVDDGLALLRESLRLKRRLSDPVGIAVLLETIGQATAHTDPERAAVLMGAAQNHWDRIDTSMQIFPGLDAPHREIMARTRARLGANVFEPAWARGRALDERGAIQLALGSKAPANNDAIESATNTSATLTRREREVAQLIHQGLSNKEIADTLVISPRTAEAHVDHILAKLGFSSRTQVATWIADQRRSAEAVKRADSTRAPHDHLV